MRGKLTLALVGASLLGLAPVVAASLRIHRMNEVDREMARVEERAEKEAAAGVSGHQRHQQRIRELRAEFSLISDRAYRDVLTLAALSLLVLGVMTVVLPRRMLRPLRRLTVLVQQSEGGRVDVARAEVTPDEVGQLADRINIMFGQLGRLDHARREKITSLAVQRDLLLEALPRPAVLLDREGQVIVASAAFAARVGQQPADLVHRRLALAGMEPVLKALSMGAADTQVLDSPVGQVELSIHRCNGDGVIGLLLLSGD